MTKEEFRRLAQSGLLFLDGATGSNLQKQGMPVGVCPELWITEHEEIMSGLQKAYLEAGTNILYAPTFTANRIKLKEFNLDIGEGTVSIEETEDIDWINNWKQYFHQFYVDDILIKPSWEELKEEDKDKLLIQIDPGTAFGTGMHETTQLCMRQLKKYVKDGMEILDVGTGTGYFAILLSQIGHQVTGIDLTDAMLREARDNAALYQVHPTFQQMDAQKLAFLDQSFDVVISRNLTWTLPDPESAYREWMRVLKKGGILLNFDADYASNVRNQNTSASHISDTEVYGHCGVTPELEQENASITLSMPMSRKQRPYWDQEFLENIGFSRSGYDLSVGQNILKEHDLKDAPMFLVWGVR